MTAGRDPGRDAARLLAVCAFALYAWAAAPGVEWLDAGELSAAGWTLGVSHPPGQPAHALLARAASMLPVGEIAFRVSLLSAAAAAAAVLGVFALARRFTGGREEEWPAALVAALLVALAPIATAQATRPEVYAPAFALCAWGLSWTMAFVRGEAAGERAAAGPALAAALAFALAAAFQPLMAAASALPAAAAIAARAGRARLGRLAAWAAALGALGLCAYAYLPLRTLAAHPSLLVWGEPGTPGAFLEVVRGRAYGGNFAGGGLGGRAALHLLLVGEGAGLPLLLLGGVGLGFAAATRLRGAGVLAAAAALTVLGVAAQKVFYADNPDVHGYLAPALAPLGAGLAALLVGGARLLARGARLRLPVGAIAAVLAAPVLIAGLVAPTTHVADAGFRRGDGPRLFLDATLLRVPPGPALFLAESDHALFPAMYERLVAGERPDVALANRSLVTSSWFLRFVDRQQPQLYVPWIDDGGDRRALAERLVGENVRQGRPVFGQLPASLPFADQALGRGYLYGFRERLGADEPVAPPPRYDGEHGRRVGRHTGMARARREARAGRWLLAVRAAGVEGAFDEAALQALAQAPRRRPLFTELPDATPVFVFADWQAELVARDAAFAAGLGAGPAPPAGAPFELRLLHAWHLYLGGAADEAEAALAALGAEARLHTARLLVSLERAVDAEAQLRAALVADPAHEGALLLLGALLGNQGRLDEAESMLLAATARHPKSPRAWASLGLVLVKQGRRDEARTAWQRSLALDPQQPDVIAYLRALGDGS